MNPLIPFLINNGTLILDGGFATQLEARGADLSGGLWSARLLAEQPELIQQVHLDYLQAGADCLITASYQATVRGFVQRGHNEAEAKSLLKRSVALAVAARTQFWADEANRVGRKRPLIAASIGPYGAYLADGSEYTGDYGLAEADLLDFHRQRWHLLAGSGADLLACETVPSATEARVYANLLRETPKAWAWVSFTCPDGQHISDGTPIEQAIAPLIEHPQVLAIGVNCTPPRLMPDLVQEIGRFSSKPIILYPNSGEHYDAVNKCWHGEADPNQFGTISREWRKLGATLIGGCCRTTPAHIQQLRDRFDKRAAYETILSMVPNVEPEPYDKE